MTRTFTQSVAAFLLRHATTLNTIHIVLLTLAAAVCVFSLVVAWFAWTTPSPINNGHHLFLFAIVDDQGRVVREGHRMAYWARFTRPAQGQAQVAGAGAGTAAAGAGATTAVRQPQTEAGRRALAAYQQALQPRGEEDEREEE
ncbi:hypothetical protein JCM10207_000694 [Rhodosporidiobolus poonsookiae]